MNKPQKEEPAKILFDGPCKHDNGCESCTVRHISGVCMKCGADLDKLYQEYKENEECDYCHQKGTQARSPTGDWCNYCGYADPGYDCKTCKRHSVNEYHLNLKTGGLCRVYEIS